MAMAHHAWIGVIGRRDAGHDGIFLCTTSMFIVFFIYICITKSASVADEKEF